MVLKLKTRDRPEKNIYFCFCNNQYTRQKINTDYLKTIHKYFLTRLKNCVYRSIGSITVNIVDNASCRGLHCALSNKNILTMYLNMYPYVLSSLFSIAYTVSSLIVVAKKKSCAKAFLIICILSSVRPSVSLIVCKLLIFFTFPLRPLARFNQI